MRRRLRAVSAGLALAFTAGCGSDDRTQVTVNIRKGSNFPEAAESLAVKGVIKYPRLFSFYAARLRKDRTTRYGMYLLERGASWNSVLDALQKGEGMVYRVRFPEGVALWDIVPILAEGIQVPEDSVLAAVRDTVLLRRLGIPRNVQDAEGYLFPDTYDFPVGATARQAVTLMVRRFEDVWEDGWDARAAKLGLTKHQVVTLASIVEKEVRKGEERPIVSGVYHNRLKIRMPLQADPTIQYALKRRRPGRVLYRDLQVESPYNTYRRVGLPPGPIASPGAKSLEAALYPAEHPYRYFVAHPDGHHEFRRTYAEHLEAIRYVREEARRDTIEQRRLAAQARTDSLLQQQRADSALRRARADSAAARAKADSAAKRPRTDAAARTARGDSTLALRTP